jgi:hypothetical protein
MRTTVELKDEHRAKLLELAARRGDKGFSDLLAEAIDVYLETLSREGDMREIALGLQGSLTGKDVEDLRRATGLLRKSWK